MNFLSQLLIDMIRQRPRKGSFGLGFTIRNPRSVRLMDLVSRARRGSVADNGLIRDEETSSVGNRTQGIVTAGPLKGKQPAIITFTKRWTLLHFECKELIHSGVAPPRQAPVVGNP